MKLLHRYLLLLISIGALLSHGNPACAQFSVYEQANSAAEGFLPMARLLQSVNNVLYGSIDFYYADQRWNSATQHYNGRLAEYLRYPELPASGRLSFRLQESSEGQLKYLESGTEYRELIRETDKLFDNDLAHLADTRYYYNSAGWIVAIIKESMSPGVSGFTETTDSFLYSGDPEKPSSITWLHKEYSTGTGFAASIHCDTVLPFHHFRARSEMQIVLDAHQNITSLESHSTDFWDDCDQGGPQFWRRTIRYDDLGRVSHIVDSGESEGGISSEYLFSYETGPAVRLLQWLEKDPSYAPFRDTAVRRWLDAQGQLQAMVLRKTAKTYTRYDYKLNRRVLSAEPPAEQKDSAYFLLNQERQRVAFWEDKQRISPYGATITFYTRLRDSAGHAAYIAQQTLNRPVPNGEKSLVQEPYRATVGSFTVQRYDTAAWSRYRIIRFSSSNSFREDGPDRRYGVSPYSLFSAADNRRIPFANFSGPQSAALLDSRGLIQYIWLPHATYKLSYE